MLAKHLMSIALMVHYPLDTHTYACFKFKACVVHYMDAVLLVTAYSGEGA